MRLKWHIPSLTRSQRRRGGSARHSVTAGSGLNETTATACGIIRGKSEDVMEPESWDVERRNDGGMCLSAFIPRSGEAAAFPTPCSLLSSSDPQYDYWVRKFRERNSSQAYGGT